MQKLIEALQILLKYGNPEYPTVCEHDILIIVDINPSDVSDEDIARLEELGISIGSPYGKEVFYSRKYGSA